MAGTTLRGVPQPGGSTQGCRRARRDRRRTGAEAGPGRQGADRQQRLPTLRGRRRRLASPSIPRQDRGRTRATMASSCCAPTPRSRRSRSCCAIATCSRSRMAFKTTKALMATRPIFHKTDAGIRGHVFCTFLALVLRKELLDRLAARRTKNVEWQCILDDLARSQRDRGRAGRQVLLAAIAAARPPPASRSPLPASRCRRQSATSTRPDQSPRNVSANAFPRRG